MLDLNINSYAVHLKTNECLMVAAHNDDLQAAKKQGMKTAFVLRKKEHGINQKSDLKPSQDWNFVVDNFDELADKLECDRKIWD